MMRHPAIEEAARLVDEVYKIHPTGGALHVVVDDWNLDDDCVLAHEEWDINYYRDHYEASTEKGYGGSGLPAEEALLVTQQCRAALAALSEEERYAALALHWFFGEHQ